MLKTHFANILKRHRHNVILHNKAGFLHYTQTNLYSPYKHKICSGFHINLRRESNTLFIMLLLSKAQA